MSKKVTAADIKRVANTYLVDQRLSVLRLTPEGKNAKSAKDAKGNR